MPQATQSVRPEASVSSGPSGSSNVDNPFWSPAGYTPAEATEADLCLHTKEVVQVLDSGLVGHPGSAILDTGIKCINVFVHTTLLFLFFWELSCSMCNMLLT